MMRFLSLPGGGIKSIIQIVFLKKILAIYKEFLNTVDTFLGTSSGGILALSLAAEKDLFAIERFFSSLVEELKKGTLSIDRFHEIAKSYFGDAKLNDLRKEVAVIVVSLSKKCNGAFRWEGEIVTRENYPTSKIADIATATIAVPGFFAPWQGMIDGGIYIADPSLAALYLSKGYIENIVVLKLGTGELYRSVSPERFTSSWYDFIIPMIFDLTYSLSHKISDTVLGKRFFAMQPILKKGPQPNFFEYEQIKYLEMLAYECFAEKKSSLCSWLEEFWLS